MSPISMIRNHPLILGGVLVAGFATWLAIDSLPSQPGPVKPFTGQLTTVGTISTQGLPDDPGLMAHRPGVVTTAQIARLHPGMPRVDVEELIGLPPAGLVQPVAAAEGKLTYRASYLANLDSMQESQPGSGNPVIPRSIIAIEFDASRPGHPLVKVHLPDPMS